MTEDFSNVVYVLTEYDTWDEEERVLGWTEDLQTAREWQTGYPFRHVTAAPRVTT